MIKLIAARALEFIGSLPATALELIRWPLPDRAHYRALVVLFLAALPLLPFEHIASQPVRWTLASISIVLALWACVDRAVASLEIAREGRLAIRAKQVGVRVNLSPELEGVHSSPWSGLPLLLFMVSIVACTLVISTSGISFSVINHLGFEGPFRANSPTRFEVLVYFAGEASRGLTFRLLDEFAIAAPAKLQTLGQWQFSLFIWLYKAAVTLLTVQGLWLWITSYFADVDPEVRRLLELTARLRAQIHEKVTEEKAVERRRIFDRQRQRRGKLAPEEVQTLRDQLSFFDNIYGFGNMESDEIRDSLRKDKKARGWFKSRKRRRDDLWDD